MFRCALLVTLVLVSIARTQEPPTVLPAAVTTPRAPIDVVKFRKAIRLPRGFQFDISGTLDLPHLVDPKYNPAREVERLSRGLTGGPNDAETYLKLAELHDTLKRESDAKTCIIAAVRLRKQQWQTHPDDARACREYGRSLTLDKSYAEAEKHLRRAVALAPTDWAGWADLAALLSATAGHDLLDEGRKSGVVKRKSSPDCDPSSLDSLLESTDEDEIIKKIDERPPAAERLKRVEELMVEADSCADRAVALAPQVPDVFSRRAEIMSRRAMCRGLIAILRKNVATANELFSQATKQALPDLIRSANCRPEDPDSVFAAAILEAMRLTYVCKNGDEAASSEKSLSERRDEIFRAAEAKLDTIARPPDKKVAARALVCKFFFVSTRGGPAACEEEGRQAVELDPDSELAWMIRIAATDKSAPDFIALCETSIRRFDHPQYRKELAAGYAAAGKFREAEEQIRHVLKDKPDDIFAQVQLSALHLSSGAPDALAKGNEALTEAERLAAADPDHREQADAAALRAAYCALNGDANTARVMLETNLALKNPSVLAKALLDAFPAPPK